MRLVRKHVERSARRLEPCEINQFREIDFQIPMVRVSIILTAEG
jgi:hypothetical protein